MKTKTLLSSFLLFSGLVVFLITTSSSSGGFSSYQAGCSCHGPANVSTVVTINGLPAGGGYTPGTAYPINVTVANGSLPFAGFQIETSAGTLSSPGTAVGIQSGNMSAGHSSRLMMSGGVAVFNMVWTAPSTGGATATFTAVGNAVDGVGTGGDAWNSATSIAVPLPLEFVDFEVTAAEQSSILQWTTANEVNVEKFIVQRSVDATFFEDIEAISLNSSGKYLSIDKNIRGENILYYRIKQVDIDNRFSLSPVRKVILDKPARNISIYPTLISNQQLFIEGIKDYQGMRIDVYSLSGQEVIKDLVVQRRISLKNLNDGLYIIRLRKGNEVLKIQKVVMQ